jgi:hypothetical protein
VSKPSSEAKQSPSAKSGKKGASSGVYSTGYGIRHGSLEYGETNAGFGGLAVMGVRHMVPDSEPPQTLYKVARPDACVWDGDSSSSPPFDKLLVYGEVSELAEGARLEIA